MAIGTQEIIESFRRAPGVESVGRWNDRFYLNLEGTSDRFAGDRSLKLWLDPKGNLILEAGKGTRSGDCRESLEAVLAFAAENEVPIIKK